IFHPISLAAHANGDLEADIISSLFQDKERRIWVATLGGGVFVLDRTPPVWQLLTHFPDGEPLPGMEGAIPDRQGRIYFRCFLGKLNLNETFTGIARLDPVSLGWKMFPAASLPGGDATVFFGSLPPEQRQAYFFNPDFVFSLEDEQMKRWKISRDGFHALRGYLFSPRQLRFILIDKALKEMHLTFDPVSGAFAPANPNGASPTCWNIFTDSRGRTWCATGNLLRKEQGEEVWTDFEGKNGLSFSPTNWKTGDPDLTKLFRFAEDSLRQVWIGSEHGLYVWREETQGFEALDEKSGLPDRHVVQVKTDEAGGVWAFTKKGVAKIDPKTRKVLLTLDRKAGLLHDQVEAVFADRQGRCWLFHAEGITLWQLAGGQFRHVHTQAQLDGSGYAGSNYPSFHFHEAT
ncbi:MAG: hypothetical protein AAB316_05255, partial [Bacteroidota bacterium]